MRPKNNRAGKHRLANTVMAVGVGAGLVSACAGGNAKVAPGGAGRPISWAVGADATGLDPQNNGQSETHQILGLVYENLVTLANGADIAPQLASSYKRVSPTVYRFTIRPDVRFTNGRVMTTSDVVDSFQRLMSKKEGSYLAGRLPIEGVRAVGTDTVEFTLRKPYSAFLTALSDPAAVILPMKELKAGTFDPTKAVLGTGPYAVASHEQGSSWLLTRNPHYWRPGLPKTAQVRITVLADEATQIAALRSGSADIVTLQSSSSYKLATAIPGVRAIRQDTASYYVLALNELATPAFKNIQTRQGINLAIDRSQVASVGLNGAGTVVGPVPGFTDSCAVSSLPFSRPDTAKAQRLLQAGGRPGPLTLIYNTAWGDSASIAQVIKAQLARVGVELRLQPLPDGQYLKQFIGGKFELGLVSYGSGTDPYFGLVDWSPALSGFTAKFSAPVPAIEAGLPTIAAESGPARADAIGKVCAAIDQDSGQIPLATKEPIIAWNARRLNANVFGTEHGGGTLRDISAYTTK